MKRFLLIVLTSVLLLPSVAAAASESRESTSVMTLNLPEGVLNEAITAALPFTYTANSQNLQGNLRIIEISDLQLLDQQLVCRLHLAGDQLKVVTSLAGQNIQLNVGEIELDFNTRASLRFDRTSQTLVVQPMVERVNAAKDSGGGDISNTILQLLHGSEFPIKIEDLEPLVTQTGAKTLVITPHIADIRSVKGNLQILLAPQISTR
ncbi:MAG: hypothetical protein ACK5PS_04760 [Desulfopila sp.]